MGREIRRVPLITPGDGREVWNPDNVTGDQVGKGFRILLKEEMDGRYAKKAQFWDGSQWLLSSFANEACWGETFRIPASIPFPPLALTDQCKATHGSLETTLWHCVLKKGHDGSHVDDKGLWTVDRSTEQPDRWSALREAKAREPEMVILGRHRFEGDDSWSKWEVETSPKWYQKDSEYKELEWWRERKAHEAWVAGGKVGRCPTQSCIEDGFGGWTQWRDTPDPAFVSHGAKYQIAPAPVMVPLGPEDILPGMAFRLENGPVWMWYYAEPKSGWVLIDGDTVPYHQLQQDWLRLPAGADSVTGWVACEKPKEDKS